MSVKITMQAFLSGCLILVAVGSCPAEDSSVADNKTTNDTVRGYEAQTFPLSLPGKIDSLLLCRQADSFVVWVRGPFQDSTKGPDVLGGLQLQVWLLRNDGTTVPSTGKPALIKLVQPEPVSWPRGKPRYQDSMMYILGDVPTRDLDGVVVRAEGKLYCFKITAENWHK